MSIDPYHPTQDDNSHSPMPGKPDPLSPGQVDLNPEHQPAPGSDPRRPPEREHSGGERVVGDTEHAERSAQASQRGG
jgi:hypothetical protein